MLVCLSSRCSRRRRRHPSLTSPLIPPPPPTTKSRCTELKAELRASLLRAGVRSMRVVPVKRRYAFEDPRIPHGCHWMLKVRGGKDDDDDD